MAYPIPQSGQPIVFDTLPAIKVQHYTGSTPVYCYARAYLLGGVLQLSLCAFERAPAPTSRIGFTVQANGRAQYLWLSPTGCGRGEVPAGCTPHEAEPLCSTPCAAERFAGQDEQGWYWGAVLALPGFVPETGEFGAAVYKYAADDVHYGSSSPAGAAGLQAYTITNINQGA